MPLAIAPESVEAVGLEVEREALAPFGHFDYLGIYIEAGGAVESDLLIAFAKFKAAALGKGLHIDTLGLEAGIWDARGPHMNEPPARLAAEHIPHSLLAFAHEAACHHVVFLGSLLHAGHY